MCNKGFSSNSVIRNRSNFGVGRLERYPQSLTAHSLDRYKLFLNTVEMTTELLIDEIFDRLDEWRNLPAYQLERRADIFFAIYLKDIIKSKFGQDVEYIVPEFPVRLGNICSTEKLNSPNLSFKIDYLAFCPNTKKVFLIELKTDDGSRREKQDLYLESVKLINIKNLIDGVIKICKASNSKKKYNNLISLLCKIGWINEDSLTNTSQDYDIEIVYIQPNINSSNKIIISFADIISILSDRKDRLTTRFIQSLEKWKINPNK
jgi:hypothetical protein